MKLKVVGDDEDVFIENGQVAFKDGKLYSVLTSSKTYIAGGCLGRMRVVVENGNVLEWIYPMLGGGHYTILDDSDIEKMREKVNAYDSYMQSKATKI
jgi:hypothetical protein